ncbi:MAG: toxin-antitoxin system TumE family protein [Candidatus Binataceae bacterium]
MPPVILEVRDVVGGGRYLQEVRISKFPPSTDSLEGIRYALCLVDLESGKVILLYDVHKGKAHHRHLRGAEIAYDFSDESKLLDDFLRDVALILEGAL